MLLGGTMLLTPSGLFAQSAAAVGPAESANSTPAPASSGLEDIVVTATRRSVNLQDVPATISAVTANTLKTFNITGVNQLVTLTSGLVSAPSGGNNLFLRGIGAPSTGYNEAQVAVYVDGLYLANPAMGIYSFNNIDRIEVLKGPQGTLYGPQRHRRPDLGHHPRSGQRAAARRVGRLCQLRYGDGERLRLDPDHRHARRQCRRLPPEAEPRLVEERHSRQRCPAHRRDRRRGQAEVASRAADDDHRILHLRL